MAKKSIKKQPVKKEVQKPSIYFTDPIQGPPPVMVGANIPYVLPYDPYKVLKTFLPEATIGINTPTSTENSYGEQLNDDILLRQIYAESAFNPNAVSKAGYKGLGQIGKTVIDEYKKATGVENVDPFNINDNLAVQKWAMNNLYNASFINKPDQDPEIRLAKTLAAYNWGRGNLSNYLNEQKNNGIDIYNSKDWINGLPKETKDYIEKILYKSNDRFNEEFKKAIEDDKYKNIIGKFNYNPNEVVIDDNRGQWAYPGEVTRIASNDITMKGVPYPVLGVGADGEQRMMYPEEEHTFNQGPVTEYPMMQAKDGGWLSKFADGGLTSKGLQQAEYEYLKSLEKNERSTQESPVVSTISSQRQQLLDVNDPYKNPYLSKEEKLNNLIGKIKEVSNEIKDERTYGNFSRPAIQSTLQRITIPTVAPLPTIPVRSAVAIPSSSFINLNEYDDPAKKAEALVLEFNKVAKEFTELYPDRPKPFVSSSFRTYEQQAELYANKSKNPFPVAKPGTSTHETGKALDISFSGEHTDEDYKKLANLMKNHGFDWLGDYDKVHFNYTGQPENTENIPVVPAEMNAAEDPAAYNVTPKKSTFNFELSSNKVKYKDGGWLNEYQNAGPVVKPVIPPDVMLNATKFTQWMKDHPESRATAPQTHAIPVTPRVAPEVLEQIPISVRNRSNTDPLISGVINPVIDYSSTDPRSQAAMYPLDYEEQLSARLGYPNIKGHQQAFVGVGEDEKDNARHSFTGMYTAQAVRDYLDNQIANTAGQNILTRNPIVQGVTSGAGALAASALGLGHEASTYVNDPRWSEPADKYGNPMPWYKRAYTITREGLEDQYNNMVGATLGTVPGLSDEQREAALQEMINNDQLPDGYGQTDVFGPNRGGDYKRTLQKRKRGGVTWLNEYQNGTNNAMSADVMTDPKKLVEWMKNHPEAHVNATPASIAPERTTPWAASDNTNAVIATPKGSVSTGTRNAPNVSVPGGGVSKDTVKGIEIVLDLAEFYPPTAVAAYIAGIPFTIMDLYDDYKKGSQPAEYVLDALGLIPGEKLGSKATSELLNVVNLGVDVKDLPENFKYGGRTFSSGGEKHRVYKKESPTGNGKGVKGHIMVTHPTKDKGKWDTIDLTKIAGAKTVAQGVAATKKWHEENPEYKPKRKLKTRK